MILLVVLVIGIVYGLTMFMIDPKCENCKRRTSRMELIHTENNVCFNCLNDKIQKAIYQFEEAKRYKSTGKYDH